VLHWITDTDLYRVAYGRNIGHAGICVTLADGSGMVQRLSTRPVSFSDIGYTSRFEFSGETKRYFWGVQGNRKDGMPGDKQE